MYCDNCGRENSPNNYYCEFCGAPLPFGQKEPEGNFSQKNIIKGIHISRNRVIIIAGAVAAAVCIAVAIFLLSPAGAESESKYSEAMENADMYYDNMEYDSAEDAYLEAIDVNPKKKDAYLKLADLYSKQGKTNKCKGILSDGKRETGGDEEIAHELDIVTCASGYDEYLQNEIIPEEGKTVLNEVCYLDSCPGGLVDTYYADFDDDSVDEMITVSYIPNDADCEALIRVFQFEDEEVSLVDEKTTPIISVGFTGTSLCSFYLKEHEGDFYLVQNSGADFGDEFIVFGLDKVEGIKEKKRLEYCGDLYMDFSVDGERVFYFEEEGEAHDEYEYDSAFEKGLGIYRDELKAFGLQDKAAGYSYESEDFRMFSNAKEGDESEISMCSFMITYDDYDEDEELTVEIWSD